MRYRAVRPASEIELGPLGYAEAATTSYELFKRLRDAGEIPSGVRFQVSLPSAVGVVNARVAPDSQLEFEPRYTEALLDELRVITDAIPNDDLAIQWDICMEMGILEGVMPHPWGDEPFDAMISRLAHLSTGVPESSELGFHLCYGDYKHTHFMEPKDLGLCVRFSNGLASAVDRSITWIHMPVPADRDDAAYFEPLTELKLDAETELYIGCVHPDGVEATQRRIDTARELTDRSFGIATECGIGRTPMDKSAHEELKELFRIHREVTVA
jgi:methionine synthase II (cobalamin-independent)